MADRESVELAYAYILHHRPYRNTSQLLDCLTRDHGLVTLVAQGSRRPKGGQRAVLQPFLPVLISWVRRGELGRLTHVELRPPASELNGERLLAGFYMNELLLRLVARGDANAPVFSCYSRALADLATRASTSMVLRLFELRLLEALGYGLNLHHDAETGEPICAERRYHFEPEHGARPEASSASDDDFYWGRALISLRDEKLEDDESLRAAKRLLSRVLSVYLGERPLKTRSVLKDIVDSGVQL
ncbi:MAG: DNA repair protein RecO [Gammaproteobacteria bacterium]